MVIGACAKLLMLAVEGLHHERIKNADLLQCFHVAMNACECCVEAVKEIVDVGFGYDAGIRCADRICVSHALPFLEGDLWSGRAGVRSLALPVSSFIFERRKRTQQ